MTTAFKTETHANTNLVNPPWPDVPEAVVVDEEASAPHIEVNEQTTLGLVELLLKEPARVDRLNREPTRQGELFPRFLLIAEASYLLYGLVLLFLINLTPAAGYPWAFGLTLPPAHWNDGTALSLPLAYTVGLVLAACICLPSFYFYSLLAGVRMTWLQITALIGKGMAINAIVLLGILPVYVAVVMGEIIFAAPDDVLRWTLDAGLLLPFAAGLWGLRALYLGLMDLAGLLPRSWQCGRRCFLRRLVLAWAAVYSAIVPILIYRLWEYFAIHLRLIV